MSTPVLFIDDNGNERTATLSQSDLEFYVGCAGGDCETASFPEENLDKTVCYVVRVREIK